MKISDILVNHLLKHKSLSLPGLGTFTLNESAYVLPDDEKKFVLPPGAVAFELDKSTPEDPGLIEEIASITGKMKSLASSDLESVVLQGNQLLNISKPFTIEGLGTLQKNHRNEVEFIPLADEQQRADSDIRLEEPGEPIRFGENYLRPEQKATSGSRNLTLAALVFIALGILGWVGYYFYQRSAKDEIATLNIQSEPVAVQDTSSIVKEEIKPADSTLLKAADTVAVTKTEPITTAVNAPAANGTEGFRIVVEKSKKDRALKRYADLREWGHKVELETADSINYKIYFPIKAPLSDSARYRDSLSHFFGRKVWVEKQ